MTDDPKTPRPRVEDLPMLQIVEIEEAPFANRLEELSDIVNRINPPKVDQSYWN